MKKEKNKIQILKHPLTIVATLIKENYFQKHQATGF